MTEQERLNQRANDILADIVDMYTSTGLPVGSKALVETRHKNLSSATIRNVMADLERHGYLTSPHTSSGRIPTEDGFRYYVKGIVEVGELDSLLRREMDREIAKGKNFNDVLTRASHLLGEMTNCTGLVTMPKRDDDPLEQVEFVRLSGNRVLAVLVLESGDIQNRVIEVPEQITVEDLNRAAARLRGVVKGQTLADARVAMMAAITEQKHEVNNMMNNMLASADLWGETTVDDGALVIAGSDHLFQYPELVRDRLKGLIQTFEEKRILMALMDVVQKGEGVQVFIGKECPLEAARDCSMITSNYGTDNKHVIGTVGVIGPMRMDYKQSMRLVDYTSQLLSRALEQTK